MSDSTEAVVILEGSLSELQRKVERLSAAGIDSAIIKPPEGRGSS